MRAAVAVVAVGDKISQRNPARGGITCFFECLTLGRDEWSFAILNVAANWGE